MVGGDDCAVAGGDLPRLHKSEAKFFHKRVEEPPAVSDVPDVRAVVDHLKVDHFDEVGSATIEFADVALGGALAGDGVLVHRELVGLGDSVVERAVEAEEVCAPLGFFVEVGGWDDVGVEFGGEADEF